MVYSDQYTTVVYSKRYKLEILGSIDYEVYSLYFNDNEMRGNLENINMHKIVCYYYCLLCRHWSQNVVMRKIYEWIHNNTKLYN